MAKRASPALRLRTIAGGASGLAAGVAAGAALLALAGVAVAHRLQAPADSDPGSLIEAAHLPPLLRAPGEPAELRYDIYCAPPAGDVESGAPCDAGGTVFARPGSEGAFRAIPLRLDPAAVEGRYVAELPADIAGSQDGFQYYAVVRNRASGASMTLPAGGAAAPQRSLPLGQAVTVTLGRHAFGRVRNADERVAAASWGRDPGQAGLEGGPETQPIGASAFDVGADGTVTVLDEANRRLLRWRRGAARPVAVPVDVNGTLADMAASPDGAVYVLETAGRGAPLLRGFGPEGRAKGAWKLAERTAAQVRIGPSGPVVLQYPSGQWLPAAAAGRALPPDAQLAAGRPGRPLPGGGEVVVLRAGNELRVALVGADGTRRSWRIRSDTPLAEVQLAEPLGRMLVLVARVYTEAQDEFLVLVLDGDGVVRRFSLDSADWAETAPLGRFRLRGSSLYQLGSTPAGMFVDRFDLGVRP